MRQHPEQLTGTVGWCEPGEPGPADLHGAVGLLEPDPVCDLDSSTEPGLPRLGDWFILHIRSRQEKVLEKTLTASGIGCFLPLMTVVRLYGKRKAKVHEPMFPGYLFLRGTRDEAFHADRTGRVVNIIAVNDQEKLEWELINLHAAINSAAPLEPFAFLKNGMRVEVRSGPFRGVQGIIEHRTAPGRLLLQIGMLGRSMSLEMDASLLDPID